MLVSMNWISDFVDLSGQNLEQLIHRFTLSTAEVEEIVYKGRDIENVVVAKIVEVNDHPSSKKLHLLKVDAGDKVYDCVCGAPNVRVGMVVPFAKAGGKVGGREIGKAELAGFPSEGMCCSEAELGISADHSGLMEIPDHVPLGTDIKTLYPIEDVIFEVDNKSLTNRPDLWGHYGLAREFAALAGKPLQPLSIHPASEMAHLPSLNIRIDEPELAFRYSGATVENITRKISPLALRIRLYYCGLRSINLLADLTNYVMLELGQPMHAFDLDKVNQVEVRRFDKPFTFRTLDGSDRAVDENTLMICSKGEPVALAGIMGGLDSEISDDTTSLFLESANFEASGIRKTSTRLGLRTDASMRYEKSLDPEMTSLAIERFLYILQQADPGVQITSSLTDCYVKKFEEVHLTIDKAYVDRYTGIDISADRIEKTLVSLGFGVTRTGDSFAVTVPSWRATKDVTIPADLIEEITRIYGYDNFQISTTTSALAPVRYSAGKSDEYDIKDMLVQRYSLHEVHSYLWNDEKKLKEIGIAPMENVRILNASTPEHAVLRPSVVPSLLVFAHENRNYAEEFGLFEVARAVEGLTAEGLCNERKKLAIVLYSREASEKTLFFRLRDIIASIGAIKGVSTSFASAEAVFPWQHPVNTASVTINGITLGAMATLHPACGQKLDKRAAVVFAELDLDQFASIARQDTTYNEPSKFPGIDIDLSFWMPQGAVYADLVPAWADMIGNTPLQKVDVTDIYEGEQNSITVRLYFSSCEKTLTREEVMPLAEGVVKTLAEKNILLKQ